MAFCETSHKGPLLSCLFQPAVFLAQFLLTQDMAHLRAVQPLNIPEKFIASLGTNVDCGHGVIPEEQLKLGLSFTALFALC